MLGRGPGLGPGMRGGIKVRPRNLRRSMARIWAYFRGERGGLPWCSASSSWTRPWGWPDRT